MKHLLLFAFLGIIPKQLYTQEYPEMVTVRGGTFLMGDSISEPDSRPHWVKLTGFKIAKTETTVLQWKVFCKETNQSMPTAPDWGWHDNHPMVNVSWNEITKYLEWLSKKTGKTYRLPTEAEWEYAAHGGENQTNYPFSGANEIDKVGWFLENSDNQPHPVGQKMPNQLGIVDMTGNVAEFCKDNYGSYPSRTVTNPTGHSTSFFRIVRGGSWYTTRARCTVTFREKYAATPRFDYIGFRVVEE